MAKSPDGPKFVTIGDERFETAEVVSGGKTYTLRELSVQEQDDIEDATKNPDGSFNGRLNMRLALQKGIISPPITADDVQKWPSKRYVVLSRAFNKLNVVPEDESGKDSAPASSGALT